MENSLTVKERFVIHFRYDHAHTGWITTCADTLEKGKVPILFFSWTNEEPSTEYWTYSCRRVSHLSVMWNATPRSRLAVNTSNHPEDITCPACNGKHRPHTNKEGSKKYTKPAHEPTREPKSPKAVPKKNAKKPLSPDTKIRGTQSTFSTWWTAGGGIWIKFRFQGRSPTTPGSSTWRWDRGQIGTE